VFEEREDVVEGAALSRDQMRAAEHGADVRTLEAISRKPVKAVLGGVLPAVRVRQATRG